MASRDHSIECEECGEPRGGLDDLPCACDRLCGRCYQEACICEPGVCICNAYMAGECCCGAWDEPLDSEVTWRRLQCLASNLAIAALGCWGFHRGTVYGYASANVVCSQDSPDEWYPGRVLDERPCKHCQRRFVPTTEDFGPDWCGCDKETP